MAKMAILGHFWTFLDILWAPPGQNGEKIDFFKNTKNVGNYPQNLSKNSLERFRMVLGVQKSKNLNGTCHACARSDDFNVHSYGTCTYSMAKQLFCLFALKIKLPYLPN